MLLKNIAFQVHLNPKLRENGNTSGLGQEYGPRLVLKFEIWLEHVAELRPYKGRTQTRIWAQGSKNCTKTTNNTAFKLYGLE